MPFRLGGWELALILVIVLVIFGVGKLPQIGGALGKSIREFRRQQKGEDDTPPQAENKPRAEATIVQSSAVEPKEKKSS